MGGEVLMLNEFKISDLPKVLNSEFIRTNFKGISYQDLMNMLPPETKNNNALGEINNAELNKFIKSNSKFKDWNEMLTKAIVDWLHGGSPEAKKILSKVMKNNGFQIK